jgi:hypothetical protein
VVSYAVLEPSRFSAPWLFTQRSRAAAARRSTTGGHNRHRRTAEWIGHCADRRPSRREGDRGISNSA